MFKIIGIDDSVTTCDCCGKANLKSTVIVESPSGEILHYGSTCATRHTNYSSKEIKKFLNDIKRIQEEYYESVKEIAILEFRKTKEYIELGKAMETARKQGLIGVAFSNFCQANRIACDAKEKELISKYNLNKTKYLM